MFYLVSCFVGWEIVINYELIFKWIVIFFSRSLVRAYVFNSWTTNESRFDTQQEELKFHIYKIVHIGSGSHGAVLFPVWRKRGV